jgi:hypothetical protein
MNTQLLNIINIGPVEVTIAPPDFPPYEFEAFVEEQDNSLLLGLEPMIREPREQPDSLVEPMISELTKKPGDVIVKKTTPLKLLAIIHDLELRTTWKTEWIEEALKQIFCIIEDRKIKNIAMPMLGTIHGSLEYEEFVSLFRAALPSDTSCYPEKIWLIAPEHECNQIKNLLTIH